MHGAHPTLLALCETDTDPHAKLDPAVEAERVMGEKLRRPQHGLDVFGLSHESFELSDIAFVPLPLGEQWSQLSEVFATNAMHTHLEHSIALRREGGDSGVNAHDYLSFV